VAFVVQPLAGGTLAFSRDDVFSANPGRSIHVRPPFRHFSLARVAAGISTADAKEWCLRRRHCVGFTADAASATATTRFYELEHAWNDTSTPQAHALTPPTVGNTSTVTYLRNGRGRHTDLVNGESRRRRTRDLSVQTTNGEVVGITAYVDGLSVWVDEFLGIPYADAPIENRRFRPPEPHPKWEFPRYAYYYPDECAQLSVYDPPYAGSEDCLFLNVWRPLNTPPGAKLPIYFYIHGGGYVYGRADTTFDGAYLAAAHNIIVVVVQYRLDVFGFMALDALSAEQSDGTTGNYGLQDQRFALRWIKENADAFGGDSERITLSGQSAGAVSVCAHMVSPASAGLFSRAIGVSPLCLSPILLQPKRQAVNFARAFAEWVGCSSDDTTENVACLRGLNQSQITPPLRLKPDELNPPDKDVPLPLLLPFLPWGPVIDGAASGLPRRPLEEFTAGRFADVPFLIGSVKDEGSIFIPESPWFAGVLFPLSDIGFSRLNFHFFYPADAIAVTSRYAALPGTPNEHGNEVVTDAWFACANRAVLRAMHPHPTRHFRGLYHFNFTIDSAFSDLFGTFHASDVPYIFHAVKEWWGPRDYRVSLAVQCYHAAFARTGNPNDDGSGANPECANVNRPEWPRYDPDADGSLVFDDPLAVDARYRKGACDFWDTIGYESIRQ